MIINLSFIRSVSDYQPYLLPKPKQKYQEDKTETLEELGILTFECD